MSDFKIIFIHGYTASHLADWYPQISESLNELEIDYVIPDLPGGEKPHAKAWLEIVHSEVKSAGKPVVLVGHSLGTRTALLYLDHYQHPVRAVFLVSAFANRIENAGRNRGEAYPDFFEYKVDMVRIKELCHQFVVIHSRDDDSIDYEQGKEIAGELEAKLVTLNGRGHMFEPDDAPYILNEIRDGLNI